MIELACPACHRELDSRLMCVCGFRGSVHNGIRDLIPAAARCDPVHKAEIARYNNIAAAGPEAYAGHAATKPEFRAKLVAGMLDSPFVEVGPGFGELLRATEGERWAVDQSLFMLEKLGDIPGVPLVRALADHLPFADGGVPALVADSVFQTVPDRERFLCEAWRVLEPGGLFVFSIAYRWNYPRRPQHGFDVRKPEQRYMLDRYLRELGFHIERWDWLSLDDEDWVGDMEIADYLYIIGRKL